MSRKSNKIEQIKKAIIEALEKTLGVVTPACKAVGISRTTFYQYVKEDPDFAAAVAETENAALDFAETALYKQIKRGVPSATIFYLKTKGRKRGFIENPKNEEPEKAKEMTEEEVKSVLKKLAAISEKYGS